MNNFFFYGCCTVLICLPLKSLAIGISYNVSSGAPKPNFNDTLVKKGDFPFVVYLKDQKGYFCTGSLISPEWVLTAGHCLDYDTTNVYYGSRWKSLLKFVYGSTVSYPFYKEDVLDKYDIGLIKLSRPIDTIPSSKLPKKDAEFPKEGDKGIGVGWGGYRRFEQNGAFLHVYQNKYPNVLRNVNLTLRSPYLCMKEMSLVPDRKLCAGGNFANMCKGDSGSPLLIGGVQWGVFSLLGGSYDEVQMKWNRNKVTETDSTFCPTGPALFVSTWHFLDWIECVMQFEKKYTTKFVGLYCAQMNPLNPA